MKHHKTIRRHKTIKQNYFKKSWDGFINSFRLDARLFSLVMAVDFAFFALLYIIGRLWSVSLKTAASKLQSFSLGAAGLDPQNIELMQAQIASVNSAIYAILFSIILAVLVILLVYCISRTIIWNLIVNKKHNFKRFGKFMGLYLVWLAIWSLPSAAIFIQILNKVLSLSSAQAIDLSAAVTIPSHLVVSIYILAIAVFHFTTILYIRFAETNKIFASIGSAFRIGATKIHHFIPAYLFIIVVAIILTLVNKALALLPKAIFMTISIIIAFLFMSWFRFYMADIVKDIKKEK